MSENPSETVQEITKNPDVDIETVEAETAEVVKKVVIKAMREEFNGPIPHPDIIKGYEEILPGSADRIIAMAEQQATHRQAMERTMVAAESRDGLLGVVFAFLLGIGCIGAAILMVYIVPQNAGAIAGAVLGATGIGSITSNFIRSTRKNNNNDVKKKGTPDDKA
nr:MAG TPA: putative membrane protein [Caudoviricetes sp.]